MEVTYSEYGYRKQTHGFPAFLSALLPGFGQLIKGQIGKAFLVWGGYIGIWLVNGCFASFAMKGDDHNPDTFSFFEIAAMLSFLLALLATFILWIWQIRDAYGEVEEINEHSSAGWTPVPVSEPIGKIFQDVPKSQQGPIRTDTLNPRAKRGPVNKISVIFNFLLAGLLIFYLIYPSVVLKYRYQVVTFFQSILQK